MEFKIRQQTDLPLSIDGQNVHVIILLKEKMVLVSGDVMYAHTRQMANPHYVKPKRPDNYAMVAYDGGVRDLVKILFAKGIRLGNIEAANFRTYSDFSNFNEEPRFNWRRWGKE
jgi:hypothetical protein